MYNFTFLALFLLLVSCECSATGQSADTIIIEEKKLLLFTNPLAPYLKQIDWKRPNEASISSGNWRGYLATWKIENKHLLLTDVTIFLKRNSSDQPRKRQSILKSLFTRTRHIIAKWYSGALIVPEGKRLNYVHMGYGSTYEKYQILLVKNGQIVEHLKMSVDEFSEYRQRKFQVFKETDRFKKEFNNLTDGEYNWSEEEAIGFMQSFYAEQYLSL